MKRKLFVLVMALFLVLAPMVQAETSFDDEFADLGNVMPLKKVQEIFPEARLSIMTQELLLEKINDGYIPDSVTPGKKPVVSYTKNLTDETHNLDVFEDGSYAVYGVINQADDTSIIQAPDNIASSLIYDSALAYWSSSVWNMSFTGYFYTNDITGISTIYSYTKHNAPFMSVQSLTINPATQPSGYLPAKATEIGIMIHNGQPTGATVKLWLEVKGGIATDHYTYL